MRKKKNQGLIVLLLILIVTIAFSFLIGGCIKSCSGRAGDNNETSTPAIEETEPVFVEITTEEPVPSDPVERLQWFARKNGLSLDEWPDYLIEFMKRYPQATDFVLNYPLIKNNPPAIDLSEDINTQSVPLFIQWDERWGYVPYGDGVIANTGCGPTCLSMVCVYLLDDPELSPVYVAEFSENNGFCEPGNGSAWTLISEGGWYLGLDVEELPLVEGIVADELLAGHPVICVVSVGDFTDGGHFIVMTEYIDGKIKINDPNSVENSQKLWDFDDISSQIENLWSCSKAY